LDPVREIDAHTVSGDFVPIIRAFVAHKMAEGWTVALFEKNTFDGKFHRMDSPVSWARQITPASFAVREVVMRTHERGCSS